MNSLLPHFAQALSLFPFSLQKTRHSEAERWFTKAHSLAPHDASVHLHYGMFLLDADRSLEAAEHFEVAAMASSVGGGDEEDAYKTLFNAAVAFRQAGRTDRAEEFYRKALKVRPKVRRRNEPSFHWLKRQKEALQ